MDKDKTIRVSDEVLQLLMNCKSESVSMSSTIASMLDEYKPLDYIRKENGKFVLHFNSNIIEIPTFTPVNKIVRISPDVYDRLQDIKAYPDESYNMIVYRLITYVTTKPFVLQLGKIHSSMFTNYKKYHFSGYSLTDIIKVIQTDAEDTKLVVSDSGDVLKTWTEPFHDNSESYNFHDKLFCLDAMAYQCDLYVSDYGNKIGDNFTLDIACYNVQIAQRKHPDL